ncbi:hypothetical protein C8035_v001131 [Colletotrichum spinosum]|uniref:Uncharacterized protein n=1 Tax=Colletotrichum spinosum TaxID=1347390 RepID=A0A4R8QTW4_9PEZI|nr:hypothetical protein C8035_v001131 [Colletotrichum spinosum]
MSGAAKPVGNANDSAKEGSNGDDVEGDAFLEARSDLQGDKNQSDEEDEEIPQFQTGSEAIAIFVPLEESLFEPFEPPKTELDRHKACLGNMEKYSLEVKKNLKQIYERERRRIRQHARQTEAKHGVKGTPFGLPAAEEALVLASVEAPMTPGEDYINRSTSTYMPPGPPPEFPPRQAAIAWSLYNVGQEWVQFGGYTAFAQSIMDESKAGIAKEITAGIESLVQRGPKDDALQS